MNANLRSTNPVDGTVLWQGNTTDTAQVAEVMQAAHQAHTRWRQTSLQRRIEIVRRYGEELTAHSDQLAKLISDETGKLPWDAAGEVKASIAKVELSILSLIHI